MTTKNVLKIQLKDTSFELEYSDAFIEKILADLSAKTQCEIKRESLTDEIIAEHMLQILASEFDKQVDT